ncbi:MAG: acetyl-CoA carboxylase carboxyltransferase subunit beta, partial [Bacteroidetes bacterium]|nr:acetyl-CoA carboxylase carboxyltransferase subunit beta [Bacteroidota bacterium]
MDWFKRIKKGISTSTEDKKETPDGLWSKCPKCGIIVTTQEHKQNLHICANCNYHSRIGSVEYFEILFDNNQFTELDKNMSSLDPLTFTDKKTYPERLKSMQNSTGLKDAVRTAHGKLNDETVVIACMDFSFIGGSMGSVVGEKIARAIDYARKNKHPMLIISKSGGARMMEAGISLMQLAKTSAKLAQLDKAGLPYISLCTDP